MDEKIEITKSQLDEINKKLDQLGKDNEFLKSIADKKMAAHYYQRNKQEIPARLNIRALNVADDKGNMVEKVIAGWDTLKDNEVWKNPATNAWNEKQTIKLIFEDGTFFEMDYLNYSRQYKQIPCERIGVIKDDATGERAFRVRRLDNGKEYTIGELFVN